MSAFGPVDPADWKAGELQADGDSPALCRCTPERMCLACSVEDDDAFTDFAIMNAFDPYLMLSNELRREVL